MAVFGQKAYLIPISFAENPIFAVFAEKPLNLALFRHLWFFTKIQWFLLFRRCQVFPRDFGKSAKFSNISGKTPKNPFFDVFG